MCPPLLRIDKAVTDDCVLSKSHTPNPNGFHWGHPRSRTLASANSMQVSIMQSDDCVLCIYKCSLSNITNLESKWLCYSSKSALNRYGTCPWCINHKHKSHVQWRGRGAPRYRYRDDGTFLKEPNWILPSRPWLGRMRTGVSQSESSNNSCGTFRQSCLYG